MEGEMEIQTIEIDNIYLHRSFLTTDEKRQLEKLTSVFAGDDRKVVLAPFGGHWAICKGYKSVKESKESGDNTIKAVVLLADEIPCKENYFEMTKE
jgi:hypothetical protein